MDMSPLEDWRGVDVSQIRAQLRMSVPERVATMVAAANLLVSVQQNARAAREQNRSLTEVLIDASRNDRSVVVLGLG